MVDPAVNEAIAEEGNVSRSVEGELHGTLSGCPGHRRLDGVGQLAAILKGLNGEDALGGMVGTADGVGEGTGLELGAEELAVVEALVVGEVDGRDLLANGGDQLLAEHVLNVVNRLGVGGGNRSGVEHENAELKGGMSMMRMGMMMRRTRGGGGGGWGLGGGGGG